VDELPQILEALLGAANLSRLAPVDPSARRSTSRRMGSKLLVIIAAQLLLLNACGGDDDAGSCNAKACGGELLGKWKLTSGCYTVHEQPMLDFCTSASAELNLDKASGTVIFDKDTYSRDFELTARLTLSLPEKCKHQEDTELECEDLSAELEEGNPLVCKDSGGGCSCTALFPTKYMESGIYTKKGNQVELRSVLTDYCVSGKTMVLRPTVTMSMGQMGDMTSTLQTTLEKQ
jgi:hypothetical protein